MEKGPLNLRASTPKREASQREIPGAQVEVVVLKKEVRSGFLRRETLSTR